MTKNRHQIENMVGKREATMKKQIETLQKSPDSQTDHIVAEIEDRFERYMADIYTSVRDRY